MESRDREIRLVALEAASKVLKPSDGIADLMIHTQWLYEFLETGKATVVDQSVVAGSPVRST
jgi:hypothetical protein